MKDKRILYIGIALMMLSLMVAFLGPLWSKVLNLLVAREKLAPIGPVEIILSVTFWMFQILPFPIGWSLVGIYFTPNEVPPFRWNSFATS